MERYDIDLFLNEAVDLFCVLDFKGKIVRLSSSWEEKLGWTINEMMMRRSMKDFIYPEDVEKSSKALRTVVSSGELINFCNRYVTKGGNLLTLYWDAKAIPEKQLVICKARDITYEKMMEEKARALEQAVQLEYMKTQFFTNISHEFRTPISIILATSNLIKLSLERQLLEVSNKNMLQKHMNSIEKNCFRLLRLINNIIDMTKIDAGYFDINFQNCDIVKLIEEIVSSTTEYVKGRELNIVFETDVKEKITACDCQAIERIILNLISNAVKFTPKNGEIKVKINDKDTKVLISVADTGIGIKKEMQTKIFERFRQADDVMTRSHEGSGIGLSLVKSLVEMHGGRIELVSEPNHGAEFIIELPVTRTESMHKNSHLFENYYSNAKIEFSDIG